MSQLKIFIALFALLAPSAWPLDKKDVSEIRKAIQKCTDAWNVTEGRGFADSYAENADFINIFGMKFSGKKEIEERHQKILSTFLKGSTLKTQRPELREVRRGLVLAFVEWELGGLQEAIVQSNKEVQKGVFTHVFVRTKGKWEIVSSSQNPLISQGGSNATR